MKPITKHSQGGNNQNAVPARHTALQTQPFDPSRPGCQPVGRCTGATCVGRQHSAGATAAEPYLCYAIAAGSLDQVLNRFASESGILLSVDGTLTAGKRSPGLNGSYGVREGLAKLLADTGLQAINSGGNYTLQKVIEAGDAVVLGATDINARGLGATTENTGSYTTGSMQTATKLALTMRETPQSVSVVTRQQMDDASLTTVQEAISKTPGLTMQKIGPERYTFYARGFQINSLLYDGLPTLLGTAADAITPANLAMYDRVEVTRGATGLVQGSAPLVYL
ncbi:TonB-dependent receptor [Pseudomonas sp. 21LCFQ02]|uniref:TonB-dependent receptor n=1 Tax=Pseudomonas sp. 21LCFQ02 TaxID=2957505 RepID=UPI00209A8DD9|nr:TonB-dependent receptor [Pseudomonas sp. 21LCFQ02]MCO8168891.1 TonB-dependent receptor [Pseudomonas sp. 21LCFQ02]